MRTEKQMRVAALRHNFFFFSLIEWVRIQILAEIFASTTFDEILPLQSQCSVVTDGIGVLLF